MTHLLVTNDFPPKVGGIQSYLWELWRRLDPASAVVLTASSSPQAAEFDRAQASAGRRIERLGAPVLLPLPDVRRRARELAAETGASLVVIDPALPLGLLGPTLGVPYGFVLHGAEVTVPARLPGSDVLLGRLLAGARLSVCAGGYPAAEARRAVARIGVPEPATVVVPPGVDTGRFRPLDPARRAAARRRFGLPVDAPVVLSLSRLVPRKGMDVAIAAAARLRAAFPDLRLVVGGRGRQRPHLEALARRLEVPVHFAGAVPDEDLPALYGCADVFVMACRDRWAGLEREGFGIVFLEAAACGVPQVAGDSGGASEAVADGETGFVVGDPTDVGAVAGALRRLLGDAGLRRRMAEAARRRAVESFDYDALSRRLAAALSEVGG